MTRPDLDEALIMLRLQNNIEQLVDLEQIRGQKTYIKSIHSAVAVAVAPSLNDSAGFNEKTSR